jgi:flagellar FliJ protein
MKGFSFKFEKILNLRQFAENEAKLDLARALSEVTELEAKLAEVIEKRNNVHNFIDNNNPHSVIYAAGFVERMQYEQKTLEEQIDQANAVVEEKKAVFAEAMKQRKIFSKLREKSMETYKKENAKREIADLDEANLVMKTSM